MTRKSYVQVDGVLYEKGTEPQKQLHHVYGDIQPYKSMVDGSMITSRSQHREHLRRHGVVEVGNDWKRKPTGIPDADPEHRRDILRAQFDAIRHDDLRRMVRKEVEYIRWNSRKD